MNRDALKTSIQLLRHRKEILQLRKERLQQELESLDLDLRSQEAEYSRLVNDDAVVYRLPNELWTHIFIMCTKTTTTVWPIISYRTSAAVLPFQVIASHVSHRWRDIALGTPLLWNNIAFNVRSLKHINGCLISQLEAHLERSGSCFLDIVLEFRMFGDLTPYCQILAEHSRRWRRLSILTEFDEVDEIREMLCSVEVPILEHLSLNLGRPEADSLSPRQQFPCVTPSILASCPLSLSFVRLAGQALGNLHPPISSVTTLHLDGWTRHYMTHDQFKAILKEAPLLINLSFNQLFLHHSRDPLAIAEPTVLPCLRALRIRGPSSPVSRFMSLLDMPQLECLTLECVETFDSQVMETVRSLILDGCAFNEQEISKLIRSFPYLSDLNIDELLPDIFYLLLPGTKIIPGGKSTEKQSLAWPQLQIIAIRDLQSVDVPYFCNMVFNRQTGGSSPLRRILLNRRSRTVLRAKQRLEWLQENVVVENSDIHPTWSIGLQYEDAHDLVE